MDHIGKRKILDKKYKLENMASLCFFLFLFFSLCAYRDFLRGKRSENGIFIVINGIEVEINS